jgi:hypothetical protein
MIFVFLMLVEMKIFLMNHHLTNILIQIIIINQYFFIIYYLIYLIDLNEFEEIHLFIYINHYHINLIIINLLFYHYFQNQK